MCSSMGFQKISCILLTDILILIYFLTAGSTSQLNQRDVSVSSVQDNFNSLDFNKLSRLKRNSSGHDDGNSSDSSGSSESEEESIETYSNSSNSSTITKANKPSVHTPNTIKRGGGAPLSSNQKLLLRQKSDGKPLIVKNNQQHESEKRHKKKKKSKKKKHSESNENGSNKHGDGACPNVQCQPPPQGCSEPNPYDKSVLHPQGPEGHCCPTWKCFNPDGSDFSFHGVEGVLRPPPESNQGPPNPQGSPPSVIPPNGNPSQPTIEAPSNNGSPKNKTSPQNSETNVPPKIVPPKHKSIDDFLLEEVEKITKQTKTTNTKIPTTTAKPKPTTTKPKSSKAWDIKKLEKLFG